MVSGLLEAFAQACPLRRLARLAAALGQAPLAIDLLDQKDFSSGGCVSEQRDTGFARDDVV